MSSKPGISDISAADRKIIDGIASGDRHALEQLYSVHFPAVSGMVTRNSGTEDEAKDIFQEAVCVLYDKVSQGGFSLNSQLKTYLFAVCRHLWLKELRKKDRVHHSQDISEIESPVSIDGDVALYRAREIQFGHMQEAMNALGEPCRSLLTDFYLKGMSMLEISEKHAYTNADNAKNQKYKCLQRLKKLYFEKATERLHDK